MAKSSHQNTLFYMKVIDGEVHLMDYSNYPHEDLGTVYEANFVGRTDNFACVSLNSECGSTCTSRLIVNGSQVVLQVTDDSGTNEDLPVGRVNSRTGEVTLSGFNLRSKTDTYRPGFFGKLFGRSPTDTLGVTISGF